MAKVTLNTIGSRYGSIDALNDNFEALEEALENTLSRDGTTPNEMGADLDMNSHDIINVGEISVDGLRIGGQPVTPGTLTYNGVVKETIVADAGQTVFDLSSITYAPYTNNLSVYIDGVYQNPSRYTETDSNTVTLSEGVHEGAVVDFQVMSLNDLGGTADACNVTYTPAGSGAVTTTVCAKLKQTVSVKDFGAVGDGVTDDGSAFVAAATHIASVGGGTINIPTGTYRLNQQWQLPANVSIKAEPAVKIIRGHGYSIITNGFGYNTSSVIPAYEGNSNITIDGLVLDLNPGEIPDAGAHFAIGYASNVTIRNCVCLDQYGNHFVDLAASQNVLIENCQFKGYDLTSKSPNTAEAIQLDANIEGSFPYFGVPSFQQNKNVTIRNCYFGDNPDTTAANIGPPFIGVGSHASVYDLWQENVLVENCIFDGMGFAGVRVLKWKNASITSKNKFQACQTGIYISGAGAGTESSKDVARNLTGKGQGNIDISISGNVFEDGIDRAVWQLGFDVGTETGAQHQGLKIQNNYVSMTSASTGYGAELRQGNDIIISGNTLLGGNHAVFLTTDRSDNIVIDSNNLREQKDHALNIGTASDNVVVSNNTFKDIGRRGVHVTGAATNGVISGNSFDTINGAAVNVQASSVGWIVIGNTFNNTNLVEDLTNPAPVIASSTTLGVVVTANNNRASNTTAPQPAAVLAAGGGYADVQYAGTPEGVITAPIGSICRNTAGGAGTAFYVKESGTGNTGWVAK
jgi:hypothetical protein